MSTNPPRWASGIVRLLIPPVSREHVLGDLHERVQAAPPHAATIAYLRDAAQTVPLVIWSEVRRRLNPALLGAQALLLYGAFVSGAFFEYGGAAGRFLTAQHGFWLVAVPTLVILVALTIIDAYTAHRPPTPPRTLRLVAFAFAVAWLVNVGARYAVPGWTVPFRILSWGTTVSPVLIVALRTMWPAGRLQDRLAVVGPGADVQTRARRLFSGMSRRTKAGYLITLGLAAALGRAAFIATNPLQRVGAGLTVAATLYMTYQLRRARPRPLPDTPDESAWLPAFEAELARQRDFHGGPLFWWRLAATIPGYLILCAGMAMAHPEAVRRPAMIGAVFLLLAVLAIPLNLRAARRYQEQLDALNQEPSA